MVTLGLGGTHGVSYICLHYVTQLVPYVFQIKYTEAILLNSTRKLLRCEITKMLTAVFKNKFTASCITILGEEMYGV